MQAVDLPEKPAQQPEPELYDGSPVPTPQRVNVAAARLPGKNYVVVQLMGPNGSWTSFLEPAMAKQVAETINATAFRLNAGLVVPPEALNGLESTPAPDALQEDAEGADGASTPG